MATILDIAKLANVSKSTVSRVVSNNGFVHPETRAMVEKVMNEVNFRPNVFAKGMRTNRSHSIGILFPDLQNPFFPEWYVVVDRISRSSGYLNYICITDPKGETEEMIVDDLLSRSIDGILVFSYCRNPSFLSKLRAVSKHTPVVCCDSMFGSEGLSCVFADGKKGTNEAVQHLLNTGKKRIAYIKGKEDYQVVNNRFSGYCEALRGNGIDIDESLVYKGEFKMECGYKAAEVFMNLPEPPDAIMAATDFMALGVLDYLRKNKFRIPEDVAVFGFDNLQISNTVVPTLSTVALPISQLAELAIQTLISMIDAPTDQAVEHILNCKLMIRQSSQIV